ncbi:hypothetical protein P9112_003190 [Eukaryota sp. TZLM1-RC]
MSASRSYQAHFKDLYKSTIETLLRANCEPKVVFDPINRKDIANMKSSLLKLQKSHLPTFQSLLDHLRKDNRLNLKSLLHDHDGSLRNCWIAYQPASTLVNSNPYLLMMDCTYKTNQYGMPLLGVMGITSFMTSFPLGFILLSGETTDDYDWALCELREVFPTLQCTETILTDREQALVTAIEINFPNVKHRVCLWHINKNVETMIRSFVRDTDLEDKVRSL